LTSNLACGRFLDEVVGLGSTAGEIARASLVDRPAPRSGDFTSNDDAVQKDSSLASTGGVA
jgi:hypothetical protein